MDIFEIIKIFAISLIEGITEWLPVSSTGHMLLFDNFAKLNFTPKFLDLFLVVIQLGAIMAVVVVYFSRLNPFDKNKNRRERLNTWNLWKKIIIGAIPAAIFGLALDKIIDEKLSKFQVIASTLIIYGILFIVVERFILKNKSKPNAMVAEEISYKTAIKIGAFQILSLIPGTSRSGSTIIGGLLCGVSRNAATEFSFFLGIPIMFGASFLKIVKYGFNYTSSEIMYLSMAIIFTFIISMCSIKFLIGYLKKHDFQIFGWYRIFLGIVVLAYFFLK